MGNLLEYQQLDRQIFAWILEIHTFDPSSIVGTVALVETYTVDFQTLRNP